jgi:hypothetical protein
MQQDDTDEAEVIDWFKNFPDEKEHEEARARGATDIPPSHAQVERWYECNVIYQPTSHQKAMLRVDPISGKTFADDQILWLSSRWAASWSTKSHY